MTLRLRPLCAALLSLVSFTPTLLARQPQTTTAEQAAPSESVSFDVYLPLQHRRELEALLAGQHTPGSETYRHWLTPQEFQSRFTLGPARVKNIISQLSSLGLDAAQTSPHRLHVTGSASQVQAAFGTVLNHAIRPNGRQVLVAASPLNLPSTLADESAVVLAFNKQIHMQHNRATVSRPANRYSQEGAYWFDDLKQAYSWPSYKVVSGKGATIGVLVDGGFQQSDMDSYFGHEKLASPKITLVKVLGGKAFDPKGDGSFEATLDLQQSGGMAPNANLVLYSIPDLSDDSFAAGLIEVVESDRADVLNMSFGGPEQGYAPEYNGGVDETGILRVFDDLFAEGNALGITFVASSGDDGSNPLPPLVCFEKNAPKPCGQLQPAVSFPASSPHVTGVGGTNLGTVTHPKHPENLDSTYLYEEAFADPVGVAPYGTTATGAYWGSGGGDSIIFKKPDFQRLISTGSKVRAVPDIALHMGGCPIDLNPICNPEDSGDILAFNGDYYDAIGTSASAPDFAGLTALNVSAQGTRIGNENYYIYLLAAAQKSGQLQNIYRQNIPGFNGLYTSGNAGYNRVLGVGTPVGKNFLLMFDAPAAGKPQTPSNP